MPRPDCHPGANSLWDCPGFADPNAIRLSENLCQGEDDLGLVCWGAPTFQGWAKHWKGIQIYNSPYTYVSADPDHVAVQKESLSRMEYVDILYAGYDGSTKNTTAALWIEGVAPIMNGLRIERSARDGLYIYEPSGPILIANSTFSWNRGHGIMVDNTTDGRVFINMTRIENNYGDGVWYRQKTGSNLLTHGIRNRRDFAEFTFAEEKPRADICRQHSLPSQYFFPHLLMARLDNGTLYDPAIPPSCWIAISLPPRLHYTYSLQFMNVRNLNPPSTSSTHLVVCDATQEKNACALERLRIPILDGIYPQTVSLKSGATPLYLALEHQQEGNSAGYVVGDVDVLFRVHASVTDKAFYGLNITNSIINSNIGSGVFGKDTRERTALSNVTVNLNQGLAGFLVKDGAADIWLNDTRIQENWGDGMNVSYAGGAITVNGTRLERNRWRGAAFHFNDSSPFLALHQEIVFKGRPSNNIFYLPTVVADNLWGGVLVGNFCLPAYRNIEPKVLINWVEFLSNSYHPALEIHSCQGFGMARTVVDVTGNRIEGNTGMGFRMAPSVNVLAFVNSNQFLNNNDTALFIKNADHPQLWPLRANVTISKNAFKFNRGKYIISIGLNEDAPAQQLIFNQQNEIRENIVLNPYPELRPRSTPYAAMVVSSSNVIIRRNCFKNPQAAYEIGTELTEHAKRIDAKENNWGSPVPAQFMSKIFDQFNRYSLAVIEVGPYAAVCNQRNPHITYLQEFFREFRKDSQPFVLGGTIYENHDLIPGRYTVTDDLHVVPGAKLTIAPGSVLEFHDGVGMLVQGELSRTEFFGPEKKVIFTSKPFVLAKNKNVRLVDDDGSDDVTEGRLEVFVDGTWGTVCNRTWSAKLAQMACNQLGLVSDPEFFENWRIFRSKGDLPMIMDNIRCEENEVDLIKCRHDGVSHNVAAGCRDTEVVAIRCAEPRWAGVRYSLLANPPTFTGQTTMHNWIIEKAGLFDFRTPEFSPALQIDWNYHVFHNLEIRNNFWNGIDIIYNDLIKKPAIRNSIVTNNRRNGMHLRSVGITLEEMSLTRSGQAGLRYNPSISSSLQRDIVSWLDMREQPELEANNIYIIPDNAYQTIEVIESHLNQRKFLIAKSTAECPQVPLERCIFDMKLHASGFGYGLPAKMAIQIVNPVSNISDEDAVFYDEQSGKSFSTRRDSIQFPIVFTSNVVSMQYTRSYGPPKLIVLVLFLDAQEYLDRFVHLYQSVVEENQYGISSVHYSNLSYSDGTITNRWSNEKLWFQKVNFTRNSDAVIWIHSPQHEVLPNTPISEIYYHLDNCSIAFNRGPVIETHRDLFASANVFHWNIWSNTFVNNSNSGVAVRLPDTYDLLAKQEHSFWMTENRFEGNDNLYILLDGYYAFANISSNNFTDNYSYGGLMELRGMEKKLVMERNRFLTNKATWLVRMGITSQSVRNLLVNAFIQYNYFLHNYFIKANEDYVDSWPRSYAVGVFGSQKAEIHFNQFKNPLMDFEVISGCKYVSIDDRMNVSYNWWGTGNDAEVAQRVFDFDDWNTFTLADYSPFYVTNELFINFWWQPRKGQLANASYSEPSVYDLKGRMFESKNLTLIRERWHQFPHYYKPFRPYRITRDLTIMPGATLWIEKGVEVHVWPNVRILVLGDLIADGTYWEPIRFKPINTTEFDEMRGKIGTRYKRSSGFLRRYKRSDIGLRVERWLRTRRANRARSDDVYYQFPQLYREDPYYQRFSVQLSANSTIPGRAGFLQIYNATTGEVIPSCDRQFTVRNAQVVCRELGYETMNAYHWLTPRWDYNPQIRLVKTYVEPRECRGNEESLDRCNLRLTGNDSQWMCMDNEHFNYIYCGKNSTLDPIYIGSWGGVSFGRASLELDQIPSKDASVLRNVEIVGGGSGHNDSFQSAGLQMFYRSPIIDHVNVTNSSMHAIQVVSPREKVILNMVNVTNNGGIGVSITTASIQAGNSNADIPFQPLTIPYYSLGMVDICAANKMLQISNRVLVYYKYDSQPVDCVKIFSSPGRKVAFRFLQVNLYSSPADLGRSDALRVYASIAFMPVTLLAEYRLDRESTPFSKAVSADVLALHFRGTAADGEYGFIAEISSIPSSPDSSAVEQVILRGSRIDNNDRGAVLYQNTGEMSPAVVIEECSFSRNGIHLYGNISTSYHAVELHLHNTMFLLFRGNSLAYNRGGLLVSARSSSAVARLNAIVKNNLFTWNSNSTTVALYGNNYQMVTMLNNIISHNYALYHDTMKIQDMSVNLTRNVFFGNTGLHTVDSHGYSRITSETQTFLYNNFEDNIALGHGHQYMEQFGYLPEKEHDEFLRRPRRQVITQEGVSFDWWTHVGTETERYRSTILAGSSQQSYRGNVFNNKKNPYELTTTKRTQYDIGSIDARLNYWGYPGVESVAAGKIRDFSDYPYLIKVDYQPVLESNSSLLEGDCPAGWFQAGLEEFKSCFLFVGAAATYTDATLYCEAMDAFVPYLRTDDVRQKEIARRIDQFSQQYLTDPERFDSFALRSDTVVWISSVTIPSTQCAWLSARTGKIGSQNCNNLLPFVCEKGTQPYVEPVLWRAGIVVAVVIIGVLVAILFLLALCWCIKSRRRNEDIIERKNIIRASIKLQRKASAQQRKSLPSHESAKASLTSSTINAYGDPMTAHRNMIRGRVTNSRSPTETVRTECSDSLSTDRTYERNSITDTSRMTSSYTPTSYSRSKPYSDLSSEGYYSGRMSLRHKVSSNPNPYEEIPAMNTFQSPGKARDGVRLRDPCSDTTYSSTVTGSCSTCPTESERDSTLTDGSWSEQSSTVSESTVQNRRLLPPRPEPPPRYESTPRLAPSRSNPNLQSYQTTGYSTGPAPPTSSMPYRGTMAATPRRSLVNLYNPLADSPGRSRKPVIETAM
ncbi:hypothetical protein Y032_0443g1557 [Ancylostoma ceylanicum]|nr:hypothetical protein Y032_0443g1557 [Ancylostoma ceylanicum]